MSQPKPFRSCQLRTSRKAARRPVRRFIATRVWDTQEVCFRLSNLLSATDIATISHHTWSIDTRIPATHSTSSTHHPSCFCSSGFTQLTSLPQKPVAVLKQDTQTHSFVLFTSAIPGSAETRGRPRAAWASLLTPALGSLCLLSFSHFRDSARLRVSSADSLPTTISSSIKLGLSLFVDSSV